jgi:hypothetical protein
VDRLMLMRRMRPGVVVRIAGVPSADGALRADRGLALLRGALPINEDTHDNARELCRRRY